MMNEVCTNSKSTAQTEPCVSGNSSTASSSGFLAQGFDNLISPSLYQHFAVVLDPLVS